MPDETEVLRRVLEKSRHELVAKKGDDAVEGGRIKGTGAQTYYASRFSDNFSAEIAAVLRPIFPEIRSGEVPSDTPRGSKRVDVRYSNLDVGLGFLISLKSVHQGEKLDGKSHFNHNMKRNDEELRVEATAHHLRQPYAVLAAVVFLPLEACDDRPKRPPKRAPKKQPRLNDSSFAKWVEYLWPLKGRDEVSDPPDQFELVFLALYAKDGSRLGFYEVGGEVDCPRRGIPTLLSLKEFLKRIKNTYEMRNGADFFYAGERPENA